jgi:neprilysin
VFALSCDDFYEFACGTFIQNTNTPDEKLSINTESVLIDELDGNLFRILKSPIKEDDLRPHKTAKKVYQTCMDAGRT